MCETNLFLAGIKNPHSCAFTAKSIHIHDAIEHAVFLGREKHFYSHDFWFHEPFLFASRFSHFCCRLHAQEKCLLSHVKCHIDAKNLYFMKIKIHKSKFSKKSQNR